jgi:hypothetical protein
MPDVIAGKVYHIKQPNFPELRFEWHPQAKRVFTIRIGGTPEVADVVALDIDNEGAAQNAVLIWLRGYREGKTPRIVGKTLVEREKESSG